MEYIGIFLIVILMIITAIIYYLLSTTRTKIRDDRSKMETSLKKRWDLTQELVETIKEYKPYEESTIDNLLKIKEQNFDEYQIDQKIDIDNNISKVVSKIIDISEDYPDIKENEKYSKISKQLIDLDKEIKDIKKSYKESTKQYNKEITKIPNNIVAILFGFNEEKELRN